MYRIAMLVVLLSLGLGGKAMALTLTTDGKSDYVIVLAADAIPAEATAAKELQAHLQLVTGATLPIRTEAEVPAGARQIVVGPNSRFKAAFPKIDLAALKRDGIVLRTVGDNLYLAGGRPRGTLYAVYTFLEDTVGCRWWGSRPDEAFVPHKPTLTIPALTRTYVPQLQYREAFFRGAFDGVYAARSKCNGHFEHVSPDYGGHYTILGWCHTFYQLLPPEKYFAQHPEWYSDLGGKRVAEGAQLCLTNEEMRKELTANALAWLRKDPQAGMISIAQNDCGGACQCPDCRKIAEEEGSESGPLLRFVNAVAADIEKEFPDTLVETLAYTYTRTPPKLVKPRPNVVVRLCTIECSYSQPLATGPQNAKFKADLDGWAAVAPQLYIWDYVTDFACYLTPHPNLRVLAPNIRFFVNHKAIGLFEQGDAGCSCSDFPELRAWLLAHLMWDPSLDDKALIAEFMRGYYGPAAEPLLGYIEVIHNAVERKHTYLTCFMGDTSSWLAYDDMEKAFDLFKDAAARVRDDATLSARLRRARMPLDFALLQRFHALRHSAKALGKPFFGPADPVAFCDDFLKAAHDFDIGNYNEGAAFAGYEPALRARFRAVGSVTVPDVCKGLPEDSWVDIQDNEFVLYSPGTWVSLVDDPKASDGAAARMTTNHNQWATQWAVPADLTGRWHVYAVVRCEATAKEGDAFQLGVYDNESRSNLSGKTVRIEECAGGEYRTYDMGVLDLKSTMYFWAAPMNNPDKVTAIYTDRIFLVQEKR
jgi:hypothetical protein